MSALDDYEMTSPEFTKNNEDLIKETLDNSFIKRRERKGSMPELETINLIGVNSSSLLSFDANQSDFLNNSTFMSEKDATLATYRVSRRKPFVLNVLRASMFRSKSLTDLNSSFLNNNKNNENFNNYSTTSPRLPFSTNRNTISLTKSNTNVQDDRFVMENLDDNCQIKDETQNNFEFLDDPNRIDNWSSAEFK
jgi:hypothetical protein